MTAVDAPHSETESALVEASAAGVAYLRRSGAGTPVVFLHGIGSQAASFAPLVPHLPAALDLVFWNAPGYGASAPLEVDWPTEEAYADALAALLDALGFDRVHLVGHSLGTLMAARFAAKRADRVATLALAACAAGYAVPVGSPLPEKVQGRIDALVALGAPEFARTRAPRLVFQPEAHPDAVAAVERAMAAVTMPGYGQAVHMLAAGRLTASLAQVTAPTTFLWGEGDVVTPQAQTLEAIAARRSAGGPEPSYHQIPNAGHALYLEQPAAVATVLAEHIVAENRTAGDTRPTPGMRG
ncbi:alpha/beta fold hydrolase [Amorphus sp. 3PC139-8]|uniref:alpha/beta fold hydrolase n=1 Tax=Amorphus sp. 3PC139-8 TaxID=2735676 RepID=UPI00345DA0F2